MDDGIIKHSQRTNPWFPAPGRRRSQAGWGRTTRRGWLPPPLVESEPLWREKIESEILADLLLQTWPQRYELRRRGRPSRGSSSAWIASFFRTNFINTWIRKVDKWYQWWRGNLERVGVPGDWLQVERTLPGLLSTALHLYSPPAGSPVGWKKMEKYNLIFLLKQFSLRTRTLQLSRL